MNKKGFLLGLIQGFWWVVIIVYIILIFVVRKYILLKLQFYQNATWQLKLFWIFMTPFFIILGIILLIVVINKLWQLKK